MTQASGQGGDRRRCHAARQHGGIVWLMTLLLLVGGITAAAGYAYVHHALGMPLSPGNDLFTIERGQSLQGVARALKRRGIIREVYSLRLYARLTGVSGSIKAGQYRFDEGINQREILRKIVAGEVERYRVQFIEGWTFREVRDALYAHPELAHQTLALSDAEIMSQLGRADEHPEGRFFPDTYDFIAGDTDLQLLARAYQAMTDVLDAAWRERDADLPIESPYEALILASIIEKETGRLAERDTISGVFVNRLRRNMRLQTDPTVIYGIGVDFDGNLRRRHLREDTPYNTYTRAGLPPTPIAMPGRESILAAVHPSETPYLYFVARGDGSHQFSRTLDEHNAAVRKFQLKSRSGG